jgi:hypothetical protein
VNEWKVIIATVVIFGTGVISGGLLVNYVDVSHVKVAQSAPAQLDVSNSVPQISTNSLSKPASAARPRLPEILSKQFVDRLEKDLQLTLGQRADIEKIIADGQDDMRKAVQNVRQGARQKIREKLTEPQKKQFDDLFKQNHPGKKTVNSTNTPSVLPPTNSPATTNSLPAV